MPCTSFIQGETPKMNESLCLTYSSLLHNSSVTEAGSCSDAVKIIDICGDCSEKKGWSCDDVPPGFTHIWNNVLSISHPMLCEPPQYAWKPCLYEFVFYFVQKRTIDNKYISMVVHLFECFGLWFYNLRRLKQLVHFYIKDLKVYFTLISHIKSADRRWAQLTS